MTMVLAMDGTGDSKEAVADVPGARTLPAFINSLLQHSNAVEPFRSHLCQITSPLPERERGVSKMVMLIIDMFSNFVWLYTENNRQQTTLA